MALTSIRAPIAWPDFLATNNLAWTSVTLDADGEYICCILYLSNPTVIRGFTGRVNSLAVAGLLTCTAETVAAFLPTGTLIDPNATIDVNLTGTGFFNATFPADVTLPAGVCALVMRRTIGGTLNCAINSSSPISALGPPRVTEFTGGETHRRGIGGAMPYTGVPTNQTYVKIPWGMPVGVSGSITAIPAGTQYGALLSVPIRGRCIGGCLHGYVVSSPSPAPQVRLYRASDNVQLAAGDYIGRQSAGTVGAVLTLFAAPVTLAPGDYILAWHSGGSGDVRFDRYSAAGTAALAAVSEVGQLMSRADPANAWSLLDAWSPFSLVFDQIADDSDIVVLPPVDQYVGVVRESRFVGVLPS